MREQIPFPEKLVGWFDIAKGVGEIALEFVTKRHLHEGISDHNTGGGPTLDAELYDQEPRV
jgi:hypothetical protein